MAKKDGGDWWKAFLWIAGGALVLYVVKTATDEEKSGMPVPTDRGGQIDFIVQQLNQQFGKQWGQLSLNVVKSYLEKALPKPVVTLVDLVYAVEQQSMYKSMTGYEKKQAVLQRLRG